MIFLHKFPEINLSPYAHKPGMFFAGIVHITTCPEIPFEAVSICKSEGHVLCISHPHSQGVLLPHFCTCLKSCWFRITNSMSWHFYTSFQRSISAHMHTNLECFRRDCPCAQHAQRFHLKQCRSANQRGAFVYTPSTLSGATYAFW